MGVMASVVVRDEVWTREQRDALPEDGCRHELIDGRLFVTPAPRPRHQFVLLDIYRALHAAAGDRSVLVAVAPVDLVVDDDTVVQPDLLVAAPEAFDEVACIGVPELVVEVFSPSTAFLDRSVKREVYERIGVPSVWFVDPVELVVTVLERGEDGLRQVAQVRAGESHEVRRPFAVRITPGEWTTGR